MYKDPEKQRQANREAAARKRAKGMTPKGMTIPGMTDQGIPIEGILDAATEGMEYPSPTADDVVVMDAIVDRPWLPASELERGQINTVSKPGDPDYKGVCCAGLAGGHYTEPKAMTRAQLQAAMGRYPADTWIGSPEHKELLRRLHTYSIDKLKAEGYWIPQWKAAS